MIFDFIFVLIEWMIKFYVVVFLRSPFKLNLIYVSYYWRYLIMIVKFNNFYFSCFLMRLRKGKIFHLNKIVQRKLIQFMYIFKISNNNKWECFLLIFNCTSLLSIYWPIWSFFIIRKINFLEIQIQFLHYNICIISV